MRKLLLLFHTAISVGWLGAVVAYLALALAARSSADPHLVRALLLAMELIGWRVIVPLSLGALATGVLQSVSSEWGLFRHYWVVAKLGLTVMGTVVLVVHMRTVSRVAGMASDGPVPGDFSFLKLQLVVHAAGGLVVLLAATALSIWKPWGRTSLR